MSRPPRALLGPAFLAAAALALHAAAWDRYGAFRDELYFVSCGNRLSAGYVDQPPAVALVARLANEAFGLWVPGLRLLPWLASAATVFATGALAASLGAGAAGAALASAAILAAPILMGLGHYLTMNAFEVLLFVLLAATLVRLARGGPPGLWLAAGVLVGAGLETKYTMGLYAASLVAGLAATPERRILRTRFALLGALAALAIALPNLAWQASHGFPFLELVRNGQLHKNAPIGAGGFLLAQVTDLNPVNLALWAPGLIALLALPALRRDRFLGVGFALLLLVDLATHAKPYYLAAAFPPLLAAGARALAPADAAPGAGHRLAFGVLLATLLATGVALAPLAVPLVPRERFPAYQAAIGLAHRPTERLRQGVLPQIFADQHGWRELAEGVAEAVAALPEADRERVFVFAKNYGEASALELYGSALGLPPVASGHNQWFLWGPPPGRDLVLVVSDEREDCGGLFRSRKLLRCLPESPWVMPYEDRRCLWLCRDPLRPLPEIWAATKIYI